MRLRVEIHRSRLYASVLLYEQDRLVATTTMDRDVTRASEQVREFIRRYKGEPKREEL
jgi:hypothetical protein